MVEVASTLRTFRIGGQLDPAWTLDADGRVWGDVRVVATLYHPTTEPPFYDPSNGAHEHPLSVAHDIEEADTEGLWVTAPLKPTIANDPDDALQPTGLGWRIAVYVRRRNEWVQANCYDVTLDGTADYVGNGETISAFGEQVVDINELIPPPATTPITDQFAQSVLETLRDYPTGDLTATSGDELLGYGYPKVANAAALPTLTAADVGTIYTTLDDGHNHQWDGTGWIDWAITATTDITVAESPTGVAIQSSTGADDTIGLADVTNAGAMSPTDKAKLDAVEAGATADQVAADVPVTPTGNLTSTDVQAALTELQTDIDAGSDDQTAAEVAVTPAGNLTSTNTQAALEEIQTELDAVDTAKLAGIEAGATADQAASEVPVTPTGNLGSTDVQAALTELQDDVDAHKGISYPHLKETGGAVNTELLADITDGRVAVGNIVHTAAYWDGSDLGGVTYRVVAAATGTDDGGSYIDAGTLQLEAVFDGPITTTQFGVTADGTTDDQPAIQAAITAAETVAGRQGKVQLPSGDIRLGSPLQIDDDVIVQGVSRDSTKLVFAGATGIKVGGNSVTTLRPSIRDLTVDGESVGLVGIRFGDDQATPKTGTAVMREVTVTGCVTAGVLAAQVAYLRLDDCDLAENGGDGLLSDPSLTETGQNTTIRAFGCRFQENGGRGVALLEGNTMSFIACSFEANDREGFLFEIPATGPIGTNRAVWLTDCYFENNLADGDPGGQLRWHSPGTGSIQQINVLRPYFSLPSALTDQFNMLIGSGIATVDYPEQLNASSRVENDSSVYLHVKDRLDPNNAKWDWDSSTGAAKINHEVWGGGAQKWQRWCNSSGGAQLIESLDTNNATLAWFGATEVAQQTGVAVTAAGIHAALVAYGLIT